MDGPSPALGGAVAAAVAAGSRPLAAAARLDDHLLSRCARSAVRLRVLEHRRLHRQADARVDVGEFPCSLQRLDLPADRVSHDLDGGCGDGDGRCDCVPVRLLHGSHLRAAHAHGPVRARPAAVVVELSRAHLRVAADPQPRRCAQLVAGEDRAAAAGLGVHQRRDVDRLLLHLASLHDPADLRGARANPRFLHRGVPRSRRPQLDDLPARDRAAGAAGHRRRLDLHVLADARRLHHAVAGRKRRLHRQRHLPQRPGPDEQPSLCGGVRDRPARRHGCLPGRREATWRVRGFVMETTATRISLRIWALLVVLFLWIPLVLICVYAFNSSNIQSWPIAGFSTKWFGTAWHNEDARSALVLSLKAAGFATAIALLLGTAAATAVSRFRFFGRDAITFLLVLPIALPGVVTGIALNSFFSNNPVHHIQPSLWTIVIGHATFCMVIVYNNVVARLRRTQASLVEASMDLGADGWQTFRFVTLPVISTALVGGALLAFALSLDEVIVPTFAAGSQTSLPLS